MTRAIWNRFIETLSAAFVPFGVVAHPKTYRNVSWWPSAPGLGTGVQTLCPKRPRKLLWNRRLSHDKTRGGGRLPCGCRWAPAADV